MFNRSRQAVMFVDTDGATYHTLAGFMERYPGAVIDAEFSVLEFPNSWLVKGNETDFRARRSGAKRPNCRRLRANSPRSPTDPDGASMSLAFHGVVFRAKETQAGDWFAALRSRFPLRLVAIDDGVFGIYVKRQAKAFEELQRVAADVSQFAGESLLYYWDNCVDTHCELYVCGKLSLEDDVRAAHRKRRRENGPLDAFGFIAAWHVVVENAFLWNQLEPLAEKVPRHGA
jgi:hypothetical protein